MKLLSAVKRSLGTVTGKSTILQGVPIVSNPLFIGHKNTELKAYFPQKNNVSIGGMEDVAEEESMLEKIEDAIMGVADSASSYVDLGAELFEEIHKVAVPGIERVVEGATKAKAFSKHLRKKGKDFSTEAIKKMSKNISKARKVTKYMGFIGSIINMYSIKEAWVEHPDEKYRYVTYEVCKIVISDVVSGLVAQGIIAVGAAAAVPTGGASVAVATVAAPIGGFVTDWAITEFMEFIEDDVLHPIKTYNKIKDKINDFNTELSDSFTRLITGAAFN